MMAITAAEYVDHCHNYDGYCVECNDFTRIGATEPDAEDYYCEACEGMTCFGTEQALLLGHLEIREE